MEHVDSGIDYHSDEGESKAQDNKGSSSSCVIGCEGQNQEHYCPTDIRCHGVQICLDGRVAKTCHDLGKKQRNRLQWDTEADFNSEECVGSWLFEDLE